MGLFWWGVIALTPLRYLIPGYPTRAFVRQYQELLMGVHLLEQRVKQQAAFIENLRRMTPAEASVLPSAQMLPTLTARRYIMPLEGQVSRGFMPEEGHWGVDITANDGDPVLAIGEGTVFLAEYSYQTGYVIGVQHPNGLVSLYKHNSRLLRRVGEKVLAGDVIAYAGGLGAYSSGPHLHLETWIGGKPIDPLQLTASP
jgi:murein DD-endopeptidase MepM/ murein hydrolase activator NlpD